MLRGDWTAAALGCWERWVESRGRRQRAEVSCLLLSAPSSLLCLRSQRPGSFVLRPLSEPLVVACFQLPGEQMWRDGK